MKRHHEYPMKITALLILAATIVACDTSVKEDVFENPFDEIARHHSAGLDHALSVLKVEGLQGDDWLESFRQFATRATTEFGRRLDADPARIGEAIDVGFRATSSLKRHRMAKTDDDYLESVITVYVDDPEAVLSFLHRIEALIYTYEDLTSYLDASHALEFEAWSSLSDSDASLVLLGAAVGRDSQIYWHENYAAWDDAMSDDQLWVAKSDEGSCFTLQDARRAGAADVFGAVAGGVAGAVGYGLRLMSRSGNVALMVTASIGASVLQAGLDFYENCME
jgi:hypothetical protein